MHLECLNMDSTCMWLQYLTDKVKFVFLTHNRNANKQLAKRCVTEWIIKVKASNWVHLIQQGFHRSTLLWFCPLLINVCLEKKQISSIKGAWERSLNKSLRFLCCWISIFKNSSKIAHQKKLKIQKTDYNIFGKYTQFFGEKLDTFLNPWGFIGSQKSDWNDK